MLAIDVAMVAFLPIPPQGRDYTKPRTFTSPTQSLGRGAPRVRWGEHTMQYHTMAYHTIPHNPRPSREVYRPPGWEDTSHLNPTAQVRLEATQLLWFMLSCGLFDLQCWRHSHGVLFQLYPGVLPALAGPPHLLPVHGLGLPRAPPPPAPPLLTHG